MNTDEIINYFQPKYEKRLELETNDLMAINVAFEIENEHKAIQTKQWMDIRHREGPCVSGEH